MKRFLQFCLFSFLILLAGCASISSPDQGTDSGSYAKSTQKQKDDFPSIKKDGLTAPICNPIPAGQIEILESFEEDCYWYAEGRKISSDYSISCELSDLWASDGEQSAMFTFGRAPETSYSTFTCDTPAISNWTGAAIVTADINNTTSKSLTVFLRLQTGNNHDAITTQEVILGAGENTNVYFDLSHDMKDENGNDIPSLIEENDIRCISFVFKGINEGGTVFIDNVNLVR